MTNKYLVLIQLVLLNVIVPNITQSAAKIQIIQLSTPTDLELIDAAKKGDKEKVEELIVRGADVNAANRIGNTALIEAARMDRKSVVELLISRCANVNAVNKYGSTALIRSTCNKKKEIIELLIKAKADVNFVDDGGLTATKWAAMNGYKEIIELLLKAGARIELKDVAIDIARNYGYEKIIEQEPSRREAVIKKWIKDKFAKEITESTSGLLIADISNIIAQYTIEYTDIPLEYRLAN